MKLKLISVLGLAAIIVVSGTWLERARAQQKKQTKRPAPAPAVSETKQGGVYSSFTTADEFVAKTEFDKFVPVGNRIFHDAKAFGGTVAVSCDMCHPNGANTHPETYPKYQVQMYKVALLRDMINWCYPARHQRQAARRRRSEVARHGSVYHVHARLEAHGAGERLGRYCRRSSRFVMRCSWECAMRARLPTLSTT